jgi:hypothetical protein
MMKAAKSAQKDLKAIMAGVKAINAAKGAVRGALAKVSRDVVACTAAGSCRAKEFDSRRTGMAARRPTTAPSWSIPDPEAISGVTAVSVDLHPEKNHPLLK